MSASLDVTLVQLTGTHAIEASAGSGKTHALVGLYLRGLLECGLDVDAIAAVTFTEAATEELAARIVRRLDAARRWFDEPQRGDAGDAALLERIVARVGDAARVRTRLGAALASLERIAVMTLHGYARRALADGAWQNGDLRDLRPVDGALARAEAARDCLRRWDVEEPDFALRLRERFGDADGLAHFAATLTAMRPTCVLPDAPDSALAEATAALARIGPAVAARVDVATLAEIDTLLSGNPALSQDRRTGYTAERVASMLDAIRRWRCTPTAAIDAVAWALHPRRIRDAPRGRGATKHERPQHPLLDLLAPAIDASAVWCRRRAAYDQWRAWRAVEAEAARREALRAEISHDRVIEALYAALTGPHGARIATRLGSRHRLLLVDEFQDTDALQFSIVARVRAGAPGGLVMIGDPKQAIYGFRGGDVHAWRRARAALDSPPQQITTNWRSTPALVAALNALFARANLFELDFVEYRPAVAADPARGPGLHDPECNAALVFQRGPDDAADPWQATAEELVRLLGDPAVTLDGRRVRPRDCAVLVRRHRDAEAMLAALAARGVPVARVANADLLDGPASSEWRRWLAALAEPGNAELRRMALAGPAFALDVDALTRMAADTAADAADRARWTSWRERLLSDGVSALSESICGALAPRLLACMDGAEMLDALRQLGAWLDHEFRGLRDPSALLARLELACLRRRTDEETARVVAAVGADAVQVMTIHAAKGLEFPIVFVPEFDRDRGGGPVPVTYARVHDAHGNVVLDLGSAALEEHLAQVERDARAEQMRLAYVALTRAVQRCYVGIWPKRMQDDGALARLLGVTGSERRRRAAMVDAELLRLVADQSAVFAIQHYRDSGNTLVPKAAEDAGALSVRVPGPLADLDWQLTSYTALVRRVGSDEARDVDRWVPPAQHASETEVTAAVFGECFHVLMERIDPSTWPTPAALQEFDRIVTRYAVDVGGRSLLRRLVEACCTVHVLPGVRWCDIDPRARVTELGFAFRIARGAGRAVAAVLRAAGEMALAERIAGSALDRPGLMRGAIDAVFAHGGRWHIVDWKTNRIEAEQVDAAIAQTMSEHGYRLQALIYQVALHRHLRARDAATRAAVAPVGDALYVFARCALDTGAPAVVRAGLAADVVAAVDAAFDAGRV